MIKKIILQEYRNFENKTFEFSDNISVIVGDNAVGKTNTLEALSLLSNGRSFKARVESEMVAYGKDLTRVSGVLSLTSPKSTHEGADLAAIGLPGSRHPSLEALITTGENGWPKKRLLVNGVPRRMIDFVGNFKIVLFGPWDMDLVTESPSIRRKFLDTVLAQVDREYRRCLLSYEKGIRQRNKLLFRIREEGIQRSQLIFWNQLLIKAGNYITTKREEFIEFVNDDSKPNIFNSKFNLEYDRSVISEGRLEQYKDEEVAAATTLVGPHRDDFVFFDDKRNLASFGSRGEQRMGVLWLKLKELRFIKDRSGELPTLLLDDIFSELDHEHRDTVFEIAQAQQTVITTADEHFLDDFKTKENKVISI